MVRLLNADKNILDVWERADGDVITEGSEWYRLANTIASNVGMVLVNNLMSGLDQRNMLVGGAGIVSALSPQTSWDRNIANAFYFADTLSKPSFCTGVAYTKALNIVDVLYKTLIPEKPTDITLDEMDIILGKGAFKTKAFFHNILDPNGDYTPTIDRHAISIWLGRKATEKELLHHGGSLKAYTKLGDSYKKVAKHLNIHYNDLQATTWIQWRLENKNSSMGV